MDFMEKLLKSDDMDTALVITGHFIALNHPFSTKNVANMFLDHIFKLHDLPTTIVSDRDRNSLAYSRQVCLKN